MLNQNYPDSLRAQEHDSLYDLANLQVADRQESQLSPRRGSDTPIIYSDGTSVLAGPELAANSNDDKSYRRSSRVFLAISLVSAALIIVLEAYMFAVINIHKHTIDSNERYTEISIYLALFIFAGVYQVVLTIIGLRTKNMLLLAMLSVFYACMLVYTGIQYQEVSVNSTKNLKRVWKNAIKGTNIATIAVLGLTLVSQMYLLFVVLRKKVEWFRFKKIGADLRIRRMYNVFQIHRALLIFDFFFFLGFTVQFIVIMVSRKSSVEFILTVCVLPLTLIILFFADFAATREIIGITVCTMALFCGGVAYVLFKMIRLYTKYTSAYNVSVKPGSYFPGRKSLITFGSITLALLFATILAEGVLMRNYNRGLLPLVSTYYHKLPGHNAGDTRRQATISMTQLPKEDDDESLIID